MILLKQKAERMKTLCACSVLIWMGTRWYLSPTSLSLERCLLSQARTSFDTQIYSQKKGQKISLRSYQSCLLWSLITRSVPTFLPDWVLVGLGQLRESSAELTLRLERRPFIARSCVQNTHKLCEIGYCSIVQKYCETLGKLLNSRV